MRKCSVRIGLIVGACCVVLWVPALAEVSTEPLPRQRARTLMMDYTFTGITDGADPIPTVSWQTYRDLPAGRQLNKNGALRPDGRPDLVYRLPTAAPLVVWAYNNGDGEHDIAFAAWENDQWGPTRFLTHSANANEVDPRVFYGPGGVIHVVWTALPVDGGQESLILLATRAPGAPGEDGAPDIEPTWHNPLRISQPGEHVGRPTVAESHGSVWVAYERYLDDGTATPTQIVIRRRPVQEAGGLFAEASVITSNRFGAVGPLLTAMHGHLWLDWQHGSDHFAYITLRSAVPDWTPPQGVPLTNLSWQGFEDVRQTIRRRVVGANATAVQTVDPRP